MQAQLHSFRRSYASAYRSIFRWAKFPAAVLGAASWGGPGTETVRAIRFTDDAIIVTGQFDKELSFGTTPLLTGPDLNGYLIALSPDLSVVYWSHSLGGTGEDIASGLALSSSAIVVTGQVDSELSFRDISEKKRRGAPWLCIAFPTLTMAGSKHALALFGRFSLYRCRASI